MHLFMAGLREWFAQTDERGAPRIPVMVNMASASISSKKSFKLQESSVHAAPTLDQINAASRNSTIMDEYSDEDEEYQIAEEEQEVLLTFLSFCICIVVLNVILFLIGFLFLFFRCIKLRMRMRMM